MQTIDLRTTQNVTIEYELASLRERLSAFLIDIVIVAFFYALFFLLFFNNINPLKESTILLYVVYGLLPIGGFIGYQLLSEVLADGQSWGKKTLGIKVVRLDGKEPSLSDFLLRAIFHIADSFISLGIMAILLISSSLKNQRLGDMTANTTVIRLRHNIRFRLEDILNINSLEDYNPQYPQVGQLNEKDMLLIKNTIRRYRRHSNPAHQNVINTLVQQLLNQLEISETPKDQIEFLKTLIRDYIVLTR